ncbi:MAG: membrane protein [Phycisphaerae bacterium]|nr:MAG: membrane protein [Phycisphaerae bacterium]
MSIFWSGGRTPEPYTPPYLEEPAGILAVLLAVLALLFAINAHPKLGKIFKVIPVLVFCYFIPTVLSTFKIIPHESALYEFVKGYVLPASLLLLIVALDLPAILRLGWKAVVMLLAGTTGIVIGGPIALWICSAALDPGSLDPESWRGLAALSGSWIGGGANFVAIGKAANVTDEMLALMVIPDVLVANIWMAVLLFMAGKQKSIDRFVGADTSAIDDLKNRMEEFQARTNRIPTMPDFMVILALGFGGSYFSYQAGIWLNGWIEQTEGLAFVTNVFTAGTWKYVFATTIGLVLSFTKARNLEGVGASKIGSVMIYLLVACIGAHASFDKIRDNLPLIYVAAIWICVHIVVLLGVARLIKAPIFFVAVGSQANIGGAASAPVVAAAFHPALAPVGALLAIAGYVLGTYAGLFCMKLLMMVAGAESV